MTHLNHNEFVPAMAEIAREAGALLMGYFQQHVKVEYKGDADLVTVADRTSEILIRERIRARWPAHDILGEEQGLVDTGSDYRWFVDPLDGTTNFAHGFPVFCVSLGLQHKDRLIAGVVYDPTRDELFAAEQGSGAWLTQQRNQASKMQVSKIANLSESLALDLCCVASGRFDGFWEFNLNPWDTAAGVLIVEEAGGKVTDFKGGPFQLNSRETLASNDWLHAALVHEFAEIFDGRGLEPLPDVREYRKEGI